MKFKQPLALVMAGALMCVSLSACSKDENGADGAAKPADAITSTASSSTAWASRSAASGPKELPASNTSAAR